MTDHTYRLQDRMFKSVICYAYGITEAENRMSRYGITEAENRMSRWQVDLREAASAFRKM